MEEKLVTILNEMAEYLSIAQMKKLQEVLLKNLAENEPQKAEISNAEYLQMFLDAKKIEGCSERTLQYYRVTVERMLQSIQTAHYRRPAQLIFCVQQSPSTVYPICAKKKYCNIEVQPSSSIFF